MDLTNLIAHWRMEESGPLVAHEDAHNNYDLSSFVSSAAVAGVLSLATDMNGSSEYLFSSDNVFRTGDIDFTICGWFKFDTLAANKAIFYLGGTLSTTIAYKVYTNGTNLVFAVSADGSTIAATATSAVALSTGTWYFFVAWHDSVGNVVGISVNDETAVTTAHAGGVYASGDTLYIGFNLAATSYSDVKVDSFSFWKRVLNSTERTQLAGVLDYPFDTPIDSPTVDEAIKKPTVGIPILAEITCGIWFREWVVDGTYTNTYKVATELNVTTVRWNLTTELTEKASAALVDANAGSWHHDGTYLWVRPLTGSIFDAVIQAIVTFYFADSQRTLNDIDWEPRILSAPNISKRIEQVFGGIGQIGGGSLTLANHDKFFSEMMAFQWNAGTVTLRLGVDLPDFEMEWADYVKLATWNIENWSRDETTFTLQLIEPKAKIKSKIPFEFFNLTDYPGIDQSIVGKPIPIAYGVHYGVSPILIAGSTKTFKVAGHAIKQFTEVRIRKSLEEIRNITTAASDWELYSGDTYRYYLPGWDAKNVTSDGDSLTEKTSTADVVSTNGTFYQEDDYVYINPQGGETISSEVYVINAAKSAEEFVITDFLTTDEANGEFTLGDDWTPGTEVSVDFEGKTDADGNLMANAIDIIEDILTIIGETNLNAASFTESRARLTLGTDVNGREMFVRRPAIYLNTAADVTEVIGDILAIIGAYLYSNADGDYTIGVMEPQQGEELEKVDDTQIMDFSEIQETKDLKTKAIVKYAHNTQRGFFQVEEQDRPDLQYISGQTAPVIRESTVGFYVEHDVEYYAQRALILEGQPLRKYQMTTPWIHLRRNPGDQLLVQSDQQSIDAVLEILEVRLDLAAKRVSLVLGNLRGFEDSCGHWVANADVLPTRFSGLTGYGAGALTWNISWHPEIKRWARQNVGYWTDANGFADSTDPESFIPSSWF